LSSERVGFLAARRLASDERVPATLDPLLRELRARRVRLGPLSLAALHEVLKGQLGRAFARPTLVRIERTSGGNPFFALELARALPEDAGPGPLPVPDDLADLLRARLRRLPRSCRRALLTASALSQP